MSQYNLPSKNFTIACDIRARIGKGIPPSNLWNLRISDDNNAIKVFYEDGIPVAYVAYANVAKETAKSFVSNMMFPQYPHEWSEGYILLILDIVIIPKAPPGAKRQVLNFLKKHRAICYLKKENFKILKRNVRSKYKILLRNRKNSKVAA